MRPHEIYMHSGLLDTLPKSGNKRRKILEFIFSLRERPNTLGDFTDKDRTLRIRQIKVIEDYSIVYWFDAPVNIVMVVEVRPAKK